MSSDAPVIRVSGLTKSYQIYSRPEHRFLQSLLRGRKRFYHEFRALDDVSFDVRRGETVGILGRNGSGKSTLLQIIAGTLNPSAGKVEVNGRTSAILELGSGFNPEFTGRENIVLSTAIAGMSEAETAARMDRIVRFADIGDYIDQPVKTYSSGMYARLTFAVAIHIDPEILIVDEALAVGDARFQAQCFRKFEEFRDNGVTILFVTHSVEQIVRHCSRAVLIDAGRLVMEGNPKAVVARYLELLFGTRPGRRDAGRPVATQEALGSLFGPDTGATQDRFAARGSYNALEHRWGNGKAQIVDYLVLDAEGRETGMLRTGEAGAVVMKVAFRADVAQPILGLTIKTPDGIEVSGNNSRDAVAWAPFRARSAGEVVYARFDFSCALNGGDYLLSLGVAEDTPEGVVPLDRRYDSILLRVVNARRNFGLVDLGICVTEPALAAEAEADAQAEATEKLQ